MLKAFAEGLKRTREEAGITLQRVSAKTRIDIKFLEAIERGDIDFLPELYVKAFIKQYAKVIGLDEEETLQDFLTAIEGRELVSSEEKAIESETPEGSSGDPKTDDEQERVGPKTYSFTDESALKKEIADEKKKQNPIVLGGGILLAIIVIGLFYILIINKSEEIIVQEKPFEEVLEQTNKRTEEVNNSVIEENLSRDSKELTLTITNTDSNDSAWVLIITDDISQQDFILLPKASKTVQAKNNFQFTLGNSGVIKLALNSNELEFNGRRRAIRYFKLDKDGMERIYSPPKLNAN